MVRPVLTMLPCLIRILCVAPPLPLSRPFMPDQLSSLPSSRAQCSSCSSLRSSGLSGSCSSCSLSAQQSNACAVSSQVPTTSPAPPSFHFVPLRPVPSTSSLQSVPESNTARFRLSEPAEPVYPTVSIGGASHVTFSVNPQPSILSLTTALGLDGFETLSVMRLRELLLAHAVSSCAADGISDLQSSLFCHLVSGMCFEDTDAIECRRYYQICASYVVGSGAITNAFFLEIGGGLLRECALPDYTQLRYDISFNCQNGPARPARLAATNDCSFGE